MNPEYKQARWAEALDGRTIWDQRNLCPDDDDKFCTEFVDPLQELADEGRFELRTITHNIGGKADVPVRVMITSALNYD
jgi:hypothetical protein